MKLCFYIYFSACVCPPAGVPHFTGTATGNAGVYPGYTPFRQFQEHLLTFTNFGGKMQVVLLGILRKSKK